MEKKHNLQCGAAQADITPKLGTILYGYAPGRPAQAVGDPLYATAIKLQSKEGCALMVTCAVAAMSPELSARLRKAAGEAAQVPAENVTISATHTHSAPNVSIPSAWGQVDTDYIDTILLPGVVKAAKDAAENLRPALMGIGEISSDVGMNRRELTEDGTVILGQNPWGPRDPKMTVISFRGDDGNILANMVHYCCHGTAAAANPEITRDWPGVMNDMLEAETGAVSGFYAGVEGDQGPNLPNGKTTGNYSMALQLGKKAGNDALLAFHSIKEWMDVPVGVIHGRVRIPFESLANREKAEAELKRLGTREEIYAQERYADVNEHIHWTNVLSEHNSGRPFKTEWTFDQSIVTIGPIAYVPCPFEAFVEIGLRLRKHSPYPYTLSLCNTHGCYGYLPTLGDMERGGYEVWHFLLAMRTTYPLPRNTDDYWVMENLALLRQGT